VDQLLKKYNLQSLTSTLDRYVQPAVAFSLTGERHGRSVFGGAPLAPSAFEWPSYTPPPRRYPPIPAVLAKLGVRQPPDPVSRPLDFLLQIDLADVGTFDATRALPQHGLLTFFYDCENQPWGYDPAHQDGFRVTLFDRGDLVTRLPPAAPLERRGLAFSRGDTLPHIGSKTYDDVSAACDLPDAYFEFLEEFERQAYSSEGGLHRMFGHSANVQGDMQLEAQLVSHGLYCGDPSGYQNPRAEQLAAGAADWVLLLQLDSDDAAQIMWGDAGRLFFWIRRQDLAARRFDRAWMSLQCG
jgi:uncharacterized protein YwqG